MINVSKSLIAASLTLALMSCSSTAAKANEYVPKYKADISANLLTPDSVMTKYAGELTYKDGFPTDETFIKANGFMDTSRAFTLFGSAVPTVAMHAMLKGHRDIGVIPNKTVALTEQLIDARSLWLTPNTTTPYAHAEINVKMDLL